MRIRHLSVLLLCLIISIPAAAEDPYVHAQKIFESRVFTNAKADSMPYRLLRPRKYNPQTKYPLILFLHGWGSGGTDNTRQLRDFAPIISQDSMTEKYPCFVISPQAPEETKWSAVEWDNDTGIGVSTEKPTKTMRLVMEILASVQQEFSIDSQRLYVTGLSMGAHGTWDLLARYPHAFAAAIPISGGGNPAKASSMKDVAVWAFHGQNDAVVPINRSRIMVKAIQQANGNARLTEYANTTHDAWNRAYREPDLYNWLFTQSKKQPASRGD